MPGGAVSTMTREYAQAIELAEFEQRHHFVHSRQRKVQQIVDIRIVQQCATIGNRLEHPRCCVLERRPGAAWRSSPTHRGRAPLCDATFLMRFPTATPRLSERECAGSVEKRRIFSPAFAFSSKRSAVAAAHVVFPTPPLPPKKDTVFSGWIPGPAWFSSHGVTRCTRLDPCR